MWTIINCFHFRPIKLFYRWEQAHTVWPNVVKDCRWKLRWLCNHCCIAVQRQVGLPLFLEKPCPNLQRRCRWVFRKYSVQVPLNFFSLQMSNQPINMPNLNIHNGFLKFERRAHPSLQGHQRRLGARLVYRNIKLPLHFITSLDSFIDFQLLL